MSRFRALDGFEAKMSRGEALKILNVPSTVSKERVREVPWHAVCCIALCEGDHSWKGLND